jgi:hypothetical protein
MYPYNHKMGQKIQSNAEGVDMDRGFITHFQVPATEALALDADGLIAAQALGAEALEITEFENAMPCARNVTIAASAVQTGDAVITGTNMAGDVITETITFDGTNTVEGNKAFKTVTKVDLPVAAGTETVNVGWGNKLGLPYKLDHNTVLYAFLDNTLEGTAPTVAVDAANLEGNTIKLNSALAGAVVDAYFIV